MISDVCKKSRMNIYREEFLFFKYKSWEAYENLKTCRVSYLGLDLSIFVKLFEVYLVTQAFYSSLVQYRPLNTNGFATL